jgi:hypothetical protein
VGQAKEDELGGVVDLGTLELRLATGVIVDLRHGNRSVDDPAAGESWDATRNVPAEMLFRVLTEPVAGQPLRTVRLAGARITGSLDLQGALMTRGGCCRTA